ncbi:hypothetical protein EYR36_003004 [Pleurotus pulmonarius]|nr:hypothetical protein EYR36_003004 [Pleurotus pulmonarius]
MGHPKLGSVIIECPLSDTRYNAAQDVEMLRIRTASKRPLLTGRISKVAPLQEGEFSQVYRGTLRIPGSNPLDVAIKTDAYAVTKRPDAFLREIDAYERKLRSFQGDSIPKCYGLYQLQDDDEIISYLVLKFSGFPIDFYVDYPMEVKTDILDKLTTLHYAGFCHGDLEDYNIVVEDGKAMFIDLEDVEPHDCQLKHAIIPKDLQPLVDNFGCREIYHTVYMLNVWQKPFVTFYGSDIYLDHIKPGRAKNILWRIRLRLQTESEFEQAYADAEKLIEDVEEWREFYASITDEMRRFTFTEDGSASDTEDSGSPLTDSRISEVVPLQEGEFTQVYRGTLRIPGFKPLDIAIKTDAYALARRPDAFVREIDSYERKLRSFQGDSIPKCYGLYQLQVDDEVTSFLVLKFSGSPIDFNVDYPIELKVDIINKLTTLHHAGFCHGDLEDYNIVVDDGKAMFIDLEDVEPHHSFVNFYGSDIYLAGIIPGREGHLLWRIRLRLQSESECEQAYLDAQKLIEDVEEWRQFYATITDERRKFAFSDDGSASEPEDSGSSSADSSSDSAPKATTIASDT